MPPTGMFSAIGARAGDPDRDVQAGRAHMAARTAAAPPMSLFMVIIPSADLSESPPESKVMPLPDQDDVGRHRLRTPGRRL